MWQLISSQISSGAGYSLWRDALPFLGGIAVAAIGFLGSRSTAVAPLQSALNDAFRSLMDEWQAERAQHIARISELEGEVRRQRSVINQGLQREESQTRLLERDEATDDKTDE